MHPHVFLTQRHVDAIYTLAHFWLLFLLFFWFPKSAFFNILYICIYVYLVNHFIHRGFSSLLVPSISYISGVNVISINLLKMI